MPRPRRNSVTRQDAQIVAGVAVVSGVFAALSGASPAGGDVPDAVLCFAFAAFITWLGATAPWWALGTAAALAGILAVGGPLVLVLAAALAAVAAFEIGYTSRAATVTRAVIAGVVVQVVLRLDIDTFFLASAICAAVVAGLIAVTGWMRRRSYVRKRVLWSLVGVVGAAVVAVVLLGIGALGARTPATDGYQALLRGLEQLQDGDIAAAQATLLDAAADLRDGADGLGGPLSQPARFVPVVAQNRNVGADLLSNAGDAAEQAAFALSVVDLDQLTISNGVIDVAALEILAEPLADLERTVLELRDVLVENDSPWLVGPIQTRLDDARERADDVAQLATGVAATARTGPSLLGADGEQRYVFLFTNYAEQRGTSGLMGNWSEVTIDDGRLQVTASGRNAQLGSAMEERGLPTLTASDDFFQRYGPFGAGARDQPVVAKFWSNVTMPPDMPTVGSITAQMYEAATGRDVDGVFVIDPSGIGALLEVTGPIRIDGYDEQLTSRNIVEFLTLGQYEFVENEREDLLAQVTERTVAAVLTGELPAPQEIAAKLGPAAVNGHISVWIDDPVGQELIETIGMDNAMPRLDDQNRSFADGLAVVTQNSNGNKIDSFLRREVDYRATHGADGSLDATVSVTLHNDAPSSGYADYVIGNIVGLPTGTNSMIVEIFTPHVASDLSVDGVPVAHEFSSEFGWNVYRTAVAVPPGGSVTVSASLQGAAPFPYGFVYRPQVLASPDAVSVDIGGSSSVVWTGTVERRVVVSASGVDAWR